MIGMLASPLATLQALDPSQPWHVTVQRHRHGRTWRLYLDEETSPRLVIREP